MRSDRQCRYFVLRPNEGVARVTSRCNRRRWPGAGRAAPPRLAPADQMSLRRSNLSPVLRSLRDHGPRSRARLAADLGLNKATVSSLVTELAERGLVRARARSSAAASAARARGRARRPDGLRHRRRDQRPPRRDVRPRPRRRRRRRAPPRPSTPAARRRRGARPARRPDQADLRRRRGPRCAAGRPHRRGGRPGRPRPGPSSRSAPTSAGTTCPSAAMLRDRLGDRVPRRRSTTRRNLAAIAEAMPGDPQRRDILVIFGEVGVGGGIVADGRLLRGSRGYAGEFGHMIVDPHGRRCGCGRIGCWETVIGLRALLDAAADHDDPVRDPALGLEDRLAEINRRADLGDTRTLAALDQVGSWVGVGAAVLANALNPGVDRAQRLLRRGRAADCAGAIEAHLHAGVLAPEAGGTRVEFSTLGFTAAVRGGATVALETVFDDPTLVQRRTARNATDGGTPDDRRPAAPDDRHRQGVPRRPRARRRRPRRPRRRGALPARPERRRQVDADQGALAGSTSPTRGPSPGRARRRRSRRRPRRSTTASRRSTRSSTWCPTSTSPRTSSSATRSPAPASPSGAGRTSSPASCSPGSATPRSPRPGSSVTCRRPSSRS